MKLACQDSMVSGRDFNEKFDKIEQYGFKGVEVWGSPLLDDKTVSELDRALEGRSLKVSTICAGYGGCLLDSDMAQREVAVNDIKRLLDAGGKIGAVGLITVPVFGPPKIPDLSPMSSAVDLELDLLVEICKELGECAEKAGTLVLLEPLNRYETHLLNRLEQASEVCERVNMPSVKMMADFFHMNIEDADMPEAIIGAKEHLRHIHLADSTRLLPGYGHTDFGAGFAALKQIGYEWFMSLECGIPGEEEEDLPRCVEYLKQLMG
jgi:sugar phosphate isomerase/epimerase